MNRIIYFIRSNWIFFLVIFFYISVFYFDDKLMLLQFADKSEHPLFRKVTVYLPFIICLLTLLISIIFNYSSVIFLAGIHIYIYYVFLFKKNIITEEYIFAYSIILPLNYFFFSIASERGIFNFNGLRRALFIAAQFFVLKKICAAENNFIEHLLNSGKTIIKYYSITTVFEIRIIVILLLLAVFFFAALIASSKQRPRLKFFAAALFINLFLLQNQYLSVYGDYMTVTLNIILNIIFFSLAVNIGFEKAYKDELTAVKGRRALNEEFHKLGSNYSIVMLDIDHFKKFNDTYGHKAGDIVLYNIAQMLNKKMSGKVFRYGGEEFTIIYKHRNIKKIYTELDNTRKFISKTKINIGKNNKKSKTEKKVGVTVSMGVCCQNREYNTPEKVLRCADEYLYKAKENGRNRVETDFTKFETEEKKNDKKK